MFLNKELKLIVGAKKSFSKKLLGQENHSCIVFLAAKIWKIWKTICSSSYILSVCSLHKMFWKMSKNYRKTLVLESLFNKVLVLQRYRLLNFLWRNILRDLILVSSVNKYLHRSFNIPESIFSKSEASNISVSRVAHIDSSLTHFGFS